MQLKRLKNMPVLALSTLGSDEILELQTALDKLGFNPGVLDGFYGPHTQTAWTEFKISVFQGDYELISSGSVGLLQKKLDELELKNRTLETKEDVIRAIQEECKKQGLGLKTQISYVLATAEHETNKTFMPVKEAYWLSEEWRRQNLRYYPFYG